MKRYNGTTWESTGAQLHLTGNNITNDSDVTGTKVKDALNTLDGKITTLFDRVGANAGGHNGIYRGKNWGTISTTAQLETMLASMGVTDGTYEDVYLGDYFKIQDGTYNVEWMVARIGPNNHGDIALTARGLFLIPRSGGFAYGTQMNSTNVTTGGYKGSAMHTFLNGTVKTALATLFGSHLKSRKVLITNAVNTSIASMAGSGYAGSSSGWEWTESYVTLMNEVEVFGTTIYSSSHYDVGDANEKLPVFNHVDPIEFGRGNFWLRTVASATYYAACDAPGQASCHGASATTCYVRPIIYIG